MNDEKNEALTKEFVRRVYLGKLRIYVQYIPPVLRSHYLEMLKELEDQA